MTTSGTARTAPLTFGRVVVIGGGCYGSWYTQQLMRAQQRGALDVQEVVVVDRDASCRVATLVAEGAYGALPVRLAIATWDDYLDEWLAMGPDALRHDAMVPSPLMPHVCLDWLMRRARARWPERDMQVVSLDVDPATPWQRAAPDGRHYVSYATWICPTNCIEPARCPAIKAPRDWSMPVTISRIPTQEHQEHAEREAYPDHSTGWKSRSGSRSGFPSGSLSGSAAKSQPTLRGTVIFQCVHRTYGVGMIDAATIAEADVRLRAWGNEGPCRVLVGTMSHCHGALGVLALA